MISMNSIKFNGYFETTDLDAFISQITKICTDTNTKYFGSTHIFDSPKCVEYEEIETHLNNSKK